MGASNILEELGLGPKGGNLANPKQNPKARNMALSAPVITTPEGDRVIGMHDPRAYDAAVPGIETEQPWHTMVMHMLNRGGFTNQDIAECAQCTPEYISILRRQRWFNEKCALLAHKKEQTVQSRLDSYALDAVEGIAEIAFSNDVDEKGNPTVPMRLKLDARRTLLEHSAGKPTQRVLSVSAHTHFSSEKEEYDSLISELATQLPTITPPTNG